ncbi:hypothetical protein WG66_013359 [Moniliophthora roreri]|nr:hypothetical protein WG66_013359 [Moniliophthora roreri]
MSEKNNALFSLLDPAMNTTVYQGRRRLSNEAGIGSKNSNNPTSSHSSRMNAIHTCPSCNIFFPQTQIKTPFWAGPIPECPDLRASEKLKSLRHIREQAQNTPLHTVLGGSEE